jgi:type IX secretion system PorP/SprF family membrane protein
MVVCINKSNAQDIHFSQYNNTPQLLNPAATGVYDGYIRAIINYKNQWQAMGNSFNTAAASIDAPIFDYNERKAHLGLGVNFFNDKAGDAKLGLTQVNLCLAGILPITRKSLLSAGVSIGGAQIKGDASALQWGNQYDGKGFNTAVNSGEAPQFNSFFYVDLAAGLYYELSLTKARFSRDNKNRIAFGLAYYHLNRPEIQFATTASQKLYGKIVATMNANFDLGDSKISLQPSAIFFAQGKSRETTFGSSIRYRLHNGTKVTGFLSESGFGIGVYYRVKDAVIPMLFYELKDFVFAASYDINVSGYSKATKYNGGFELSLKYNMLKGAVFKQKNVI